MYSFTLRERRVFKTLLMDHFGLEFEEHRHNVLDAAVSRRMKECNIDSAAAYERRLEHDSTELGKLVDAATNNLSRFFRNADQLRAITEFIVPQLNNRGGSGARGSRSGNDNPLSIWVAGCATGEEPYSLAMTLADVLPELRQFHITATDISRRSLDIARTGAYSPARMNGVPPATRARCFTEEEGQSVVSEQMRRRISFVEHNLMKPPPVHDADVVLCRNVLTYLAPTARRVAVRRLRDAMRDDGFLLLGNSESLPRQSGFTSVSAPWARVYRRSCPPQVRTLP
jgi:chemotaxis protein methyltransferase CheR